MCDIIALSLVICFYSTLNMNTDFIKALTKVYEVVNESSSEHTEMV